MSVLCEIKNKLCSLVDGDDLATAKLCLIEDGINGPCPTKIEGVNAEAGSITVDGDMTENFCQGKSVNLLDANGLSIGTGVIESSTFSAETGLTTVVMGETDLNEGATLNQAVAVKPVKALTVKAIKTVAVANLKAAPKKAVVKRG